MFFWRKRKRSAAVSNEQSIYKDWDARTSNLGPLSFDSSHQLSTRYWNQDGGYWSRVRYFIFLYFFTLDLSLVLFNVGYLRILFYLLLGFSVLSFLSDVLKHIVESVQSNNVLPKIWKTQKLRCSCEVVGPAKQ